MSEESETTAGGDGVIEEQRRECAWVEATDLPRPALTQGESLARPPSLPPPAPLERYKNTLFMYSRSTTFRLREPRVGRGFGARDMFPDHTEPQLATAAVYQTCVGNVIYATVDDAHTVGAASHAKRLLQCLNGQRAESISVAPQCAEAVVKLLQCVYRTIRRARVAEILS